MKNLKPSDKKKKKKKLGTGVITHENNIYILTFVNCTLVVLLLPKWAESFHQFKNKNVEKSKKINPFKEIL